MARRDDAAGQGAVTGRRPALGAGCAALALAGCEGAQSALAPRGPEAATVAELFWIMAAAGGVIWALVVGLALYALHFKDAPYSEALAGRLILWGGAVLPTLLLALLLAHALWIMPGLRPLAAATAPNVLRIEVVGQQFWWRVRYWPPGAEAPVETANAIHLPAGQRVGFMLSSPDVIHSFWIPALAGKMDMIHGRTNLLTLEASVPGRYRGACAEFCGTAHALMAFEVEAMAPAEFAAWLEGEAGPAIEPAADLARSGQALFLAHGCGACHAIRGTEAAGLVGPDLTHLAARRTIAAGTLPNTEEALLRFITDPAAVKPEARMPAFSMLPAEDLRAIAHYLGTLR